MVLSSPVTPMVQTISCGLGVSFFFAAGFHGGASSEASSGRGVAEVASK